MGDIVYKRNSEDGIIAIWTTTCTFQSVTSTYKFLYELYVNGDSTHMLTHRFCDMAKGRSRNAITLTKNEWRLFVSPIWNEHLNKMSLKSKILDL